MALLVAVLALTGCISTSSASGPAAIPESEAGPPQYGGIFRYAPVGVQTGYDPIKRGLLDPSMNALYDSLMRYNADGIVEPYLAESLESADTQNWTLTLRPGVMFHDGTPLDAEAVVFNIRRHQDPNSASRAASYVRDIVTVEAVDAQTVHFGLTAPIASFPSNLTTAVGAIASPTAVRNAGEDYGRTVAVGAGPFRFEQWQPDQRLTLRRNPEYWQEGLPYLDEFQELPMSDTETRFAAYQGGAVEAAWFQEPTQINWAIENPDLATLHASTGGVGGTGLVFQLQTPPFDDLRVRRAVAMAVDYDALNNALFQGSMPTMEGPFVEGSYWYTGTADWPDFDPDAARALVEEYEAEHGGDLAFTLGCHSAPSRRRYAELIQNMLTQVGMTVALDTPDVAEYVDRVNAKDYQIGCFPKNGTDPDLVYFPSFSCSGPTTSNVFGYCNEAADAALIEGRRSVDLQDRKAAYEKFEEIIAQDLPMLWQWGDTFSVITKPNVYGYVSNPANPEDFQPGYLWLRN
ncbi:ABC transporter substrate-binding protein [Pseudonocardia aurantiaca]|uniref:ABC transporter substrate-binding protein n=1 Tax=Pseudonocardia aurantiaca TaxID=75290 RepID=A0ABW4FR57_9PSEU